MSHQTADQIASMFYAQGLGGRWLTAKQTAWLYGVAERETREEMRRSGFTGPMGYSVTGNIHNAAGELVAFWSLHKTPNGSGVLQVRENAAPAETAPDPRLATVKAAREYGMSDETIAQLLGLSLATVAQLLNEV